MLTYVTQILPLTLIFFTATHLIRARPKNFETKAILASFSEVFGLDSREEKRKESKYKWSINQYTLLLSKCEPKWANKLLIINSTPHTKSIINSISYQLQKIEHLTLSQIWKKIPFWFWLFSLLPYKKFIWQPPAMHPGDWPEWKLGRLYLVIAPSDAPLLNSKYWKRHLVLKFSTF